MSDANSRLTNLAESANARFWSVDYEQLSVPERVFRTVWELEAEVNNGGFVQYFDNSSGELVPFILASLHAIGANAVAVVVEQAIKVVGACPWSDDAARRALIGQLSPEAEEKLEGLDQDFFKYPDDLSSLLYRYVQTHSGEIEGVPKDF